MAPASSLVSSRDEALTNCASVTCSLVSRRLLPLSLLTKRTAPLVVKTADVGAFYPRAEFEQAGAILSKGNQAIKKDLRKGGLFLWLRLPDSNRRPIG